MISKQRTVKDAEGGGSGRLSGTSPSSGGTERNHKPGRVVGVPVKIRKVQFRPQDQRYGCSHLPRLYFPSKASEPIVKLAVTITYRSMDYIKSLTLRLLMSYIYIYIWSTYS